MGKVQDTRYFKYYNANPKGRKTSDCVVRAICTALNQDYSITLVDLTRIQIQTGYSIDEPRCYGKYLEMKGWVKCKQPRNKNGTKIKGKDFYLVDGVIPCVMHIGGHHLSCIIDGRIHDTWDCSGGCVGNYWVPEKYISTITSYGYSV